MESRERDRDGEARPRRHLSSLVVRPSTSESDVEEKAAAGVGGGGRGRGGGGGEEGEKRFHAGESFHALSDRLYDGRRGHQGYGERSGSVSPLHQRRADHDYDGNYNHRSPLHHGRGFERGRGPGRGQGFSPPYSSGRSKQPHRRDFGRQEMEPAHFRDEGISGNNHNISPREGDWLCSDPRCGNLNFARRSFCHNCKKGRFEREAIRPIISPRRRYPGPLPPLRPPPQMSGPPVERVSRREFHISGAPPPREWRRDGPREYAAPTSPRRGERFPDLGFQMDRGHYHGEVFREMGRSDGLLPPDWVPRSKGRGDFSSRRREYSDRNKIGLSTSPPLQLPRRAKWVVGDERERSRSPPRSGGYKDSYMGRARGYPQVAERRRMNINF